MSENDTPPEMPDLRPSRQVMARARFSRKRLIGFALVVGAIALVLGNLKMGAHEEKAKNDADIAAIRAEAKAAEAAGIKETARLYGGLSNNGDQRALLTRVSSAFTTKSDAKKSPVPLRFHLLAEADDINLFAASSGDIYVTTALLNRMQTEGQLAAVIAHGIAHVMAGDVAKPSTHIAQWLYSPESEAAADALSVGLMAQAGYSPEALVGMFNVLAEAYRNKAEVYFFVSHPNADGRIEAIESAIKAKFPDGVPAELSK